MGCGEEEREEEQQVDGHYQERETTIKKGLLWQQRDKIFSRWVHLNISAFPIRIRIQSAFDKPKLREKTEPRDLKLT
jgi:hypothetical protein